MQCKINDSKINMNDLKTNIISMLIQRNTIKELLFKHFVLLLIIKLDYCSSNKYMTYSICSTSKVIEYVSLWGNVEVCWTLLKFNAFFSHYIFIFKINVTLHHIKKYQHEEKINPYNVKIIRIIMDGTCTSSRSSYITKS